MLYRFLVIPVVTGMWSLFDVYITISLYYIFLNVYGLFARNWQSDLRILVYILLRTALLV